MSGVYYNGSWDAERDLPESGLEFLASDAIPNLPTQIELERLVSCLCAGTGIDPCFCTKRLVQPDEDDRDGSLTPVERDSMDLFGKLRAAQRSVEDNERINRSGRENWARKNARRRLSVLRERIRVIEWRIAALSK